MVYYFTGTGNSKYLAKVLKEQLNDDIRSLNDAIKYQNVDCKCNNGVAVFCTPTYSWRMPRVVTDFILNNDFGEVKDAYFALTCGDNTCNAYKYCKKLCDKKGWNFKGFYEIIMPNNYCMMFTANTMEEAEPIIKAADPVILDLSNKIKNHEEFVIKKNSGLDALLSGPVNSAFYKFLVSSKKFYVTDECIGCGNCVKLCPLNNIKLIDKKPVFGKDCTHCAACISACPKQCIEYRGVSEGKPKYYLDVNMENELR